jgi:hypothetical protein
MTRFGIRAKIGAGVALVLGTGSTAAYAVLTGSPIDSSGVIHAAGATPRSGAGHES